MERFSIFDEDNLQRQQLSDVGCVDVDTFSCVPIVTIVLGKTNVAWLLVMFVRDSELCVCVSMLSDR